MSNFGPSSLPSCPLVSLDPGLVIHGLGKNGASWLSRASLLLGIFAGLVAWIVSPVEAKQSNIVFILADDLGWMDLGCYGSRLHETPNIDGLAADGIKFTQAYTAGSVCSPTRSSIMSGKVPARTGVTDYIPGLNSNGRKLVTEPTAKQLALEEVTIAETLAKNGYQTFYAGKWHLGNAGYEPSDQGFEVSVLDEQLGNHGRDWQVGKRISESATKFLDERDATRPFFMFLGYHEPHTPILEYPDHIARFRAKGALLEASKNSMRRERDGETRLVQNDPAYASEVAGLDSFVGSVLSKLKEKELTENTIVVFFSDNGGLSTKAKVGPTSNEPLRAGKGWLYEGGIRVPCIMRVPQMTRPATTSETPIFSTDFYPTLLELAGIPLVPEQHCDGISFASLLPGATQLPRDTYYWHYPHYHGSTWKPGAAIREGNWKLIEFFEEGIVELYDIQTDIGETTNVAAKYPEIAARLQDKLVAWRKEIGATVPKPRSGP